MILRVGQLLVLVLFVAACGSAAQVEAESGELSAAATATAEYALREYRQEIIGTLARLVSFETVRVFSHYTGMEDVRLLPNGVSFGPHMPGRPYSGHTEGVARPGAG